jgi:hypothetical protein
VFLSCLGDGWLRIVVGLASLMNPRGSGGFCSCWRLEGLSCRWHAAGWCSPNSDGGGLPLPFLEMSFPLAAKGESLFGLSDFWY